MGGGIDFRIQIIHEGHMESLRTIMRIKRLRRLR